jgi:hypothetical protein
VNTRLGKGRAAVVGFVFLCGASHVAAQGWAGGVKGGVGQGGFTGSREFNWNRTLPSAAVFINRSLSDRFSFQPELVQTRRVGVSNVGGSTLTLTADHIQIPLLLQLKVPSAVGLMPFLFAGPHVGVKLQCTLAFAGGGVRSADDCDADRGVQSHRLDFGVTGGGGFAWPVAGFTFGVEGRIAAGLRTFVVPLDEQNSKSYGWSVLAGVSLPLRRLPISRAPAPVPVLEPMRPPPSIFPGPAVQPDLSPARTSTMRRVTINAVDADVRALLMAIARESGLNVVVSSDVRSRISVTLSDVSAAEAVQAIVDVAGLSILPSQSGGAPAIVFHQRAVDLNKATPEVITSRFGVSAEMAKWITESRPEKRP